MKTSRGRQWMNRCTMLGMAAILGMSALKADDEVTPAIEAAEVNPPTEVPAVEVTNVPPPVLTSAPPPLAPSTNDAIVVERIVTNAPPLPPPPVEPTISAEEAWKSFMQLQGQMDTALLAIERSRREREIVEQQNQRQLEQRLKLIEQTIDDQRTEEAQAMREANQTMLFVAGLFAVVGFLAMVLTSFFHFRSMQKLSGVIAALPFDSSFNLHALSDRGGKDPASLVAAEEKLLADQQRASGNGPKLLQAIERLEHRIHELENTSHGITDPNPAAATGLNGHEKDASSSPSSPAAQEVETRVNMVLGKGQALLNMGQAEEAIVCFEEVLASEPKHADAWVKKGAAMEKLNRLDEAIACYDEAISVNGEMTLAYLYKGGVFNRLERYNDALACYEKALKTQNATPSHNASANASEKG